MPTTPARTATRSIRISILHPDLNSPIIVRNGFPAGGLYGALAVRTFGTYYSPLDRAVNQRPGAARRAEPVTIGEHPALPLDVLHATSAFRVVPVTWRLFEFPPMIALAIAHQQTKIPLTSNLSNFLPQQVHRRAEK